jgi:hypothetical protein
VPRVTRHRAAAFLLIGSALAVLAAGTAPNASTRDIAKCVSASVLRPGSRNGVIQAATRRAKGFEIRRAGHAKAGDLNYDLLAKTCSRAMVRRTWYIDLHPPGMQCGACDSHEYWVLLRRGGWTSLGYFGG